MLNPIEMRFVGGVEQNHVVDSLGWNAAQNAFDQIAMRVKYLTNPVFVRVRDPHADIRQHPISEPERIFVTLVILHVNTVFYAMKDDLMVEYENLKPDLVGFFSNPIPRTVWQANKNFQNAAFVEFMENILGRP